MKPKHTKSLPLAGLAAAIFTTTGLFAAPLTWTGDVDDNWSTDFGPGDTNWDTNTVPVNGDTAIFADAALGVSSTVDAATTIDFLTINQSTTSATNKITLGADLTIDSNGGGASGINYGSTISNASMFELDLDGNALLFNSQSGGGITNNLYGTYTFDTAGGAIQDRRRYGTGGGDQGSINIGSGSNLAVVNVTANGSIGATNTANTDRFTRDFNVNIGAGSEVNLSNNSTFTFLRQARSDGSGAGVGAMLVNNSGTIDIGAGSKVEVRHIQVNSGNSATKIELNNLTNGAVDHNGTLAMTMTDRGTANITNAGTWNVGSAALITGELSGQGSGDTGVVTFANQAGGVITGASASTAIDYNALDTATFLNQSLTITNSGIISAGIGHDNGTASVGTLSLTDINIDASTTEANTFRFDLASTSLFDVIDLTNGTLALDNTFSILDVYFVDSFAPTDGDSFDIFDATSITGNFASINLFNGMGDAADSNNWSFDNSTGVLSFNVIPEPSSALLILGSLGLLIGRRRRA